MGDLLEAEEKDVLLTGWKLGGGAFAEVVAGFWLGTDVAVKKVNVECAAEFAGEVRVLSSLRHPNIVLLLATVTPLQWILYERLEERLDVRAVSADFHNVLKVSIDIAKALAYAHSKKVIHRDLKPSNVIHDGRGLYKVADWGLARFASSDRMTGDTGTYAFMAPEVVRSDYYNSKCDVYSFGVLLWTLVSGSSMPYPYYTPAQAATGVVKSDLRPTIPGGIDTNYKQLMIDCWAPDMNKRPEFVEVLTRMYLIKAEVTLRERENLPKKRSSWWG